MKHILKNFRKKYLGTRVLIFLLFLALSFVLWSITKLGHTYMAYVPVHIKIESNSFKTMCLVKATGSKILFQRYLNGEVLKVGTQDIHLDRSFQDTTLYIVNKTSLQNVLSMRLRDFAIVSVGDMPEIQLEN